MSKIVIEVNQLTKRYDQQKGVFDLNFSVYENEILGLLGANGSGKTTIIRQIMGFIKPDSGHIYINQLDAWTQASLAKNYLSYMPGELSFPEVKSGSDFLALQASHELGNSSKAIDELLKTLDLNPSFRLKRMSRGMRQKTALISALMNDKDIIVLDEPTLGLDPLMRRKFIDLIRKQKALGKTILITSHNFSEMEQICDRVVLLKNGKMIDLTKVEEIINNPLKTFQIGFKTQDDLEHLLKHYPQSIVDQEKLMVKTQLNESELSTYFKVLRECQINYLSEIKYSLEEHFRLMYQLEGK